MIFNPFSIVLLLTLIFCFVIDKSIKQIFLRVFIVTSAIQLFVQVGFFMEIGNFDLNYRTVCEIVILFLSLLLLIKKGRLKMSPYSKQGLIFIAVSLVSILFLLIVPSDVLIASIDASWDEIVFSGEELRHPRISGFVIQQTFQFFVAILAILAFYETFDNSVFYRLLKSFSIVVKIFLVIGLIEFILKYLFSFREYGEVVKWIFGLSDSTIVYARYRGFGVELQGLTKEASHFAYVLFVSTIILLADHAVLKSKNSGWIFLSIVLLFFCMSFSALLFGSGLIFIFVLYRWNKLDGIIRYRNQLITGAFFIFISIFFISQVSDFSDDGFFSRRILSLVEEFGVISSNTWETQEDALEWSNRVRLLSVYISFKAFLSRPVIGFGLGTVTSHGSTIMMLCGVGVLGLYVWIKTFFSFLKTRFYDVNALYLNIAIFIFLFVNALNSLGLRPFYEFHTFLLAIAFMFLFSKSRSYENFNYNPSV
jgi:hypothetical protein